MAGQLFIFPIFGISVPLSTNLWLGAFFTILSVIRGYVIRRWFNAELHKVAIQAAKGLGRFWVEPVPLLKQIYIIELMQWFVVGLGLGAWIAGLLWGNLVIPLVVACLGLATLEKIRKHLVKKLLWEVTDFVLSRLRYQTHFIGKGFLIKANPGDRS
jgi:hypothetical protein